MNAKAHTTLVFPPNRCCTTLCGACRLLRAILPVLGLLILQIPESVEAQKTRLSETSVQTTEAGQVVTYTTTPDAWGLKSTDWDRYLELMQGPAGLWYRHVSPVMVLGINANTEIDRARYARIAHQQEKQRLEALFAFNRAYLDVARVSQTTIGANHFNDLLLSKYREEFSFGQERVILIVRNHCPQCDRLTRALVDRQQTMDIFVAGVQSDQDIQRWARQANVPAARVISGEITLNHELGTFSKAGYSMGDLPLVFLDPDLQQPLDLPNLIKP